MHVGIAKPRWRGKRSRHSRRMRNPQFYVSGKRPIYDMAKRRKCNIPKGFPFTFTYIFWQRCLHDLKWVSQLYFQLVEQFRQWNASKGTCRRIMLLTQFPLSADSHYNTTTMIKQSKIPLDILCEEYSISNGMRSMGTTQWQVSPIKQSLQGMKV